MTYVWKSLGSKVFMHRTSDERLGPIHLGVKDVCQNSKVEGTRLNALIDNSYIGEMFKKKPACR